MHAPDGHDEREARWVRTQRAPQLLTRCARLTPS